MNARADSSLALLRFAQTRAVHIVAAAFLAATFSAQSITPTPATTIPHTLRFSAAEDVATLNPELTTQLAVSFLSQMTAAYAFRLDHNNRLIPELATAVPTQHNRGISPDGTTITLHLRRGVTWSDGALFNADDVSFTIAEIQDPVNLVPSREGFDKILAVDEPDKYTVVVHLKEPYGAIVPKLFASNGVIAILPKHVLQNAHSLTTASFNSLPIGIGPFRYISWKRGDQIDLERNPYYWRGRAKLDCVSMKLITNRETVMTQLQTDEIDMWYPLSGAFLSRIQALPKMHLLRQPSYSVNQILFNVDRPVLNDRNVREALRDAVDRETLRTKVSHGVGILQDVIVPTTDPLTPRSIPFRRFDLNAANALLDRSGWKRAPDGVRVKNGTRLSVNFVSSVGTPDADVSIELIRATWQQIGVEMTVQRFTSPVLFAPFSQGGVLANGRFDAMLFGRYLPSPFDITLAYACTQIPPLGQNVSHYCNHQLDTIAGEYDASYDDAKRAKLLSNALHIIDDDAAIIVTSGREDLFALNNAIQGFTPNNATPFDDMMHVDVNPEKVR